MKYYLLSFFIIILFFNFSPVLLKDSSGFYVSPQEEPLKDYMEGTKDSVTERDVLLSRGGEDRLSRDEFSNEVQNDFYEVQDEIEIFRLNYSEEDLYWLARVIHSEAPGDTTEGQLAVANVVLNSLNDGWSDSIKNVIFQKINGTYQFTPVEDGKIYNTPSQRAMDNAIRALSGERVIPINIYYFYMPAPYNQNDWIRSRTVYKKIGIHLFCF
jgi:spore germination cell wall hydrolase CwlJ-like protein